MIKIGIDVSVWNGNIDWAKAKNDIDFAILRAGFGKYESQKDKQFENYYKGCKENNIPVGAYWYCYATTEAQAIQEAQVCKKCLKGKELPYQVWYDIEENSTFNTGRENTTKIARAFIKEMEKDGYKVGIYSSLYTFRDFFTDEIQDEYDIWLAHVGNGGKPIDYTPYKKDKALWQYSWTGNISGIKGNVDMDRCYKDFSGDTPEPTPQPTPEPSSDIDVIYSSYIGSWLGDIKNYNDKDSNGYSGIDQRPITGFTAKTTKGTLRYRVHLTNGQWLNWIETSNKGDWAKGVAGIKGKTIDGLQAELVGVKGYQIQYRTSILGSKDYLNWITGYGSGNMGYSGIYGKNIDKVQMRIVKI